MMGDGILMIKSDGHGSPWPHLQHADTPTAQCVKRSSGIDHDNNEAKWTEGGLEKRASQMIEL